VINWGEAPPRGERDRPWAAIGGRTPGIWLPPRENATLQIHDSLADAGTEFVVGESLKCSFPIKNLSLRVREVGNFTFRKAF